MKKTILTIGAITLLTACTTANTTTQVAESAAQILLGTHNTAALTKAMTKI